MVLHIVYQFFSYIYGKIFGHCYQSVPEDEHTTVFDNTLLYRQMEQ